MHCHLYFWTWAVSSSLNCKHVGWPETNNVRVSVLGVVNNFTPFDSSMHGPLEVYCKFTKASGLMCWLWRMDKHQLIQNAFRNNTTSITQKISVAHQERAPVRNKGRKQDSGFPVHNEGGKKENLWPEYWPVLGRTVFTTHPNGRNQHRRPFSLRHQTSCSSQCCPNRSHNMSSVASLSAV